jgi:hypothetical protein
MTYPTDPRGQAILLGLLAMANLKAEKALAQ